MFFVARSTGLPQLPLVQQQRWAADRLEPGGHHNVALSARCRTRLDPVAVDAALEALARRCDLLRAAYPGTRGRPSLRVASRALREVSFVDGRELHGGDAELARRAAELARRPFDVERGPLWRAGVFRIGDDEHLVVVAAHRLIADRASLRLLLLGILDPSQPQIADGPQEEPDIDVERELSRWLVELSSLEALALPTDHPRPRIPLRRRAREPIALPGDLCARVDALAAAAGVAPTFVLAAAVERLLCCYAGRADVALGVVDRPVPPTSFGPFSRTLLLRNAAAASDSATDLVRAMFDAASRARERQSLGVETAAEALGLGGREAAAPVPQVVLAVEESSGETAPWSALTDIDTGGESADLAFSLQQSAQGVRGYLDYDRDLFDASTAQRIVTHFENALAGLAAGEAPSRISLFGLDERARIVSWSNARSVRSPPAAAAHEMFEAQANRVPGKVALVSVDESLTYAELEARANRLAHHLRSRGVAPSSPVAILLDRSADAIVAILAVLKSGAAYLPLDTGFPRDRIAAILADSGARLAITQSALEAQLPRIEAIRVDADADQIDRVPADRPPRVARPFDLAYVIYTSGSTGHPKGVGVEHRSLSSYVAAAGEAYGITENDRVLQFASLSFDASIEEIFLALCRGATLVLRPEWMLDSVALFLCKCGEWGITALSLPTAYWHELARRIGAGEEHLPECLRLVVIGGEAARADLVAAWIRRVDRKVRLLNTYGPTETTVVATCWDAASADPDLPPRDVPIGKPLANSTVYVLGPALEPLPIGVAGELYVGGAGVARGYFGRDALTAERFLPDPFAGVAGARMYRTGDRCRLLPNGELEFVGRADDQVKVRGFRVEPSEIETQLAAHPAVEHAAVVARTVQGAARLSAYVVARHHVEPAELLAFLRRRLPEFMVPSSIVLLPTLPKTSSGKIDRRALAQLAEAQPQRIAAPRSPVEELVARAFSETLHVASVGMRDPFFAIGGSSLAAVQLAAALSERLGHAVDVQDVFECPTVETLSHRISHRLHGGSPRPVHADDLVADAVLDPAIRPPGSSVAPARLDHGVVLLTGVTGFFGVFVLRDLLRKTSGAIHCLVRAGDADDARARIAAAWLRAIGGDVELPDRVVPVAGDLAKPKLGMSDAQWDGIADAADVLVHAGALVSYLLPYRSLRSANVLGTEEILRLAAHRKPKTVHYVSTVDVAHATGRLAPENDELASAAMLADGYAQSKWVAERLAAIGRERGIPVTVYRPGRLVGDSQTGAANQNDFLLRVVQACVRAGAAPRLDVQTDMTPVDYASAALVALAGAGPVGRVYHLVNPAPVAWDDLVRALGEFGYRIATMPFADWTNVLRRSARRAGASGDAFGTYLAGLDEHRVRAALEAVHGCERTVAELERHAVRCPAVDGQVLRMYFTRLVRSGFFPPPL